MKEILAEEFLSILQKAFDTVDRQILLAKFDQCWNRGVSNDQSTSYLSNRNHFLSINGYDSTIPAINYGIP